MIRLIQLEWMKIGRTRYFWWLVGLFLLALLALPIASKFFLDWLTAEGEKLGGLVPSSIPVFDFVDIWQNLAFIYKYFSILLGFVMLISVTNEFTNKTMRQNVIDGLSKTEWLGSKLLMAVFLSLATTLVVFLIGLVMGLAYSPVKEIGFIFEEVSILGAYFLHLLTFLTFCIFIASLIRKPGFAIALTIFYYYIVEPIITSILYFGYRLDLLSDSFPRSAQLAVIPNPFPKYILREVENFVPMEHLLICLAWLLFFTWATWRRLQRKDM